MVDCGELDKIIKINGKMDKSDTYKGFSSSDISFFIPRVSSDKTFLKIFSAFKQIRK